MCYALFPNAADESSILDRNVPGEVSLGSLDCDARVTGGDQVRDVLKLRISFHML